MKTSRQRHHQKKRDKQNNISPHNTAQNTEDCPININHNENKVMFSYPQYRQYNIIIRRLSFTRYGMF